MTDTPPDVVALFDQLELQIKDGVFTLAESEAIRSTLDDLRSAVAYYAGQEERAETARERHAQAAENAPLPSGYIWGKDAVEQFKVGKRQAAAAVRASQ